MKSAHENEEDDEDEEEHHRIGREDVDSDKQSSVHDDLAITQPKIYNIKIKSQQTLKFEIKFSPKDVRHYNFELPLTLSRFGKLPGLTRMITCKGIKPKFLMEPPVVEFPRKIM
jgi:hypothetical protein